MGDIYVVDNDFIDKLAKIDELELLRLEGNKIVITDKVYEELNRGWDLKISSATKARRESRTPTNQMSPTHPR